MSGATLVDLKGGADIKNQSMGLMRAVFTSCEPLRREPEGSQPRPVAPSVCNLKDADLTDVVLMGSDLSGANLTGARSRARTSRTSMSAEPAHWSQGSVRGKDWAERLNVDRAVTQATN